MVNSNTRQDEGQAIGKLVFKMANKLIYVQELVENVMDTPSTYWDKAWMMELCATCYELELEVTMLETREIERDEVRNLIRWK